jgi:hypothetical protein
MESMVKKSEPSPDSSNPSVVSAGLDALARIQNDARNSAVGSGWDQDGEEDKGAGKVLVKGAGLNSVMAPLHEQTPGLPYTFYQKLVMNDMKPTGLKMSACFCVCDNTRTEMYTVCDQSIAEMKNVKTPLVELVLEMHPAARRLGREESGFGLLHRKSRGGIGSWVRAELSCGFPQWMMRVEEQNIYLVGNSQDSDQKVPICTARFIEAHVDQDFKLLTSDAWAQCCRRYYSNLVENHSSFKLVHSSLSKYYDSADKIFTPTKFAKVSWMMSHAYSDLWEIIYHGKVPELLWELNMLAGGDFEQLVSKDSDPQGVAVQLPKEMTVGETYESLCFVDKNAQRAAYVLAPEGKMQATEVVLAVFANYSWEGLLQDGQTIKRQDLDLLSTKGRAELISFANGETKTCKSVNLQELHRP